MRKTSLQPLLLLLALTLSSLTVHAALTLDECYAKAESNYPLIRQYGLLEATTDIELADIDRTWLPKVGLYAQSTIQNAVPAYPDALSNVLQQMGQQVKGLSRLQYKAGADISQTIWDGGASRARRALTLSKESATRASLDVDMYAIRSRVQSLFFAILLTDRQIAQASVTYDLLSANAGRLESMYRNGTAMKADVDMLEAQKLTVGQSIISARSSADALRRMLALFIDEDPDGIDLLLPSAEMPTSYSSNRPELQLMQKRIDATQAALRVTNTSLMPKIGFFAQAFYGYPGFDYFHSMMSRTPSFNILGGVKISWNIDSFYSRRDNRRRTALDISGIESERETFLFNSDLQTASKRESIDGIRRLMADDEEIIRLRADVRKAAESQLANGVIDATSLLSKIADEETARLTADLHEIRLLQEIHELKNILNR